MNKQDRITMEQVFMQFARTISLRSVCKRHGTGAVIVSPDYLRILGMGYNGPPMGAPHDCNGEVGNCKCIHSEINAIIKAGDCSNSIMFCTHSPCMDCARYIIQAQIKKIFYGSQYRDSEPIEYLKKFKIICTYTESK